MYEELTPRFIQVEVSRLSIPQSRLNIALDRGCTHGLIASLLPNFTQVPKVILVEYMLHWFQIPIYC
jgi:hypothetical protein